MLATRTKIKSKDPLRDKIAEVSEVLWDKPGKAITRIAEILREAEVEINGIISFNDSIPDFRTTFILQNLEGGHPGLEFAPGELGNMLVFAWHRMPSGRFEITTYLS